MKNYIQPGKTLSVTAPAAVSAGVGVLIGSLFGVAAHSAAISTPVEIDTEGVFLMAKETGAAWTVGAPVFWDDTNKRFTLTDAANKRAGIAVVAAASGDATGYVKLIPIID